MRRNSLIIFLLILCLAAGLRTYKLDSIPPGLFGDEVDVGYQAYSLLTTGKDLTGRVLPFYLRSLSEFRTPLYIYSAVPFVGIFGLNEWGVRLPAVFWGLTSIIGMFLLVRKLFNENAAFIVMILASLSPWHIQYSRASFEVTMLLTFIIFGVYFFLKGLQNNQFYPLSVGLFASSIYIYSTAVVFSPFLFLMLLIIFWNDVKKIKVKMLSLVILTGAFLMIPLGLSIITGEAKERFSAISIFQDSVLLDKINLARKGQEFFTPDGQSQKTSPQVESYFYNRPMIFLQVFITNYFRSLSPTFLFTEGDINFRQSIHEMGEMYYFEAILLVLGMFALSKLEWQKASLVFGWLLIAPIPASLTFQGGFHATRLIIMLPPLLILSGLGGEWILKRRKEISGKILFTLVSILIAFNLVFYFYRYYVHYAPESWRWWHVGYKEAMKFIKTEEQNFDLVGFNNTYEPSLIRFLFWSGVNPKDFQENYNQTLQTREIFPGYNGFKFTDKYFFGSSGKPIQEVLPPKTMYLVSSRDEVPGDWDWSKTPPGEIKVLKTIRNPLNEPIFYVVAKN